MADFILPIASKTYETDGVMSIWFDPQGKHINYQAGQFLRIQLSEIIDPRGPSRFFSIASSPTENSIMIATKISQSPFKQKLANASIGDAIQIQAPFGKFVLSGDTNKHHLFLSGGIGITPFRSILTSATDRKLPHKITLLYSNKTRQDIVFKDDLAQCAKKNPNLTIIHTITRSTVNSEAMKSPPQRDPAIAGQLSNDNQLWETGRINEAIINRYVHDLPNAIFYICGPPSMVEAFTGLVKAMGILEENLRLERFTGYQ